MVVDQVHDHRNTALVGLLHELAEAVRAAELILNRKHVSRVIAGRVSPEVAERHHFNGVDSKPSKVIELLDQ